MPTPPDEETTYRLLRILEREPEISQRRLASELGVSLGKTNYCLRALVDKGLIKVSNFQASSNKRAYLYLLTPQGIEAKARATLRFLRTKRDEYQRLQREIERLQQEVSHHHPDHESRTPQTQPTE